LNEWFDDEGTDLVHMGTQYPLQPRETISSTGIAVSPFGTTKTIGAREA